MPKNEKLPNDVVKNWPEIFSDIVIFYIPLEYTKSMTISFSNGKKIYIDVEKSKTSDNDREYLEKSLKNFLENYRDEIEDVDFNLDVKNIKLKSESFSNNLLSNFFK